MADDETSTDDGHDEPTDTEELTDDDTGSDDVDETEPADDWTPPSKEDFEKLRATAEARKEDIRKLRAAARAAKKTAPDKRASSQPASQDDPGSETEAPADDRWKATAARQDIAAALLEAGFTGDRKAAKEFAGLGALADVEVDDDGIVNDDDVEAVVDAIKAKYSGMFASSAPSTSDEKPPPGRRPTTADRTARDRRTPESSSSRTSQALLRQGGYRR